MPQRTVRMTDPRQRVKTAHPRIVVLSKCMETKPHAHLQRIVNERGSQAAAARHLGIAPSYLGDLLRGRRRISDRILKKLGLRRIVVQQGR